MSAHSKCCAVSAQNSFWGGRDYYLMASFLSEDDVEKILIEQFQELGYARLPDSVIGPDGSPPRHPTTSSRVPGPCGTSPGASRSKPLSTFQFLGSEPPASSRSASAKF